MNCNYCCQAELFELPSTLFYDSEIEDHHKQENTDSRCLHVLRDDELHYKIRQMNKEIGEMRLKIKDLIEKWILFPLQMKKKGIILK